MPNTTASDIVQFLKSFELQQHSLEEFLGQNSQLKHHIVQDMAKVSIDDLCYLIELYKDDNLFGKYLLMNLL